MGNTSTAKQFQSPPPARGATAALANISKCRIISIHAPREGGDYSLHIAIKSVTIFQSTPPARGATKSGR